MLLLRKFQNSLVPLTLLPAVLQPVLGALFIQHLDDLPQGVDYDFIVAGGGTAGSTVASHLSENQDWKILVIEAGPSNEDIFNTHVPGLWTSLMKSSVDWNYTSVPQEGLNGRVAEYARGKLLGGCSSHNTMLYTRGSRDDWDRWARIAEDEGLNWDNILPLLQKAEHLTPDSANQPEQKHLDPSIHGKNGTVSVSLPYTNIPFNDMLLQASEELKEEFPFKLDMNDGRPIGTGWYQWTIDQNGVRSSSATAYLAKTGDNVHVLLNTYVTRVLPVSFDGVPDFRGIELAPSSGGQQDQDRVKVIAKKEVIVSGGVIGTPQLLMNSRIGNREDLDKVGVRTLVDNPSVGKNLSDHASTSLAFATTTPSADFDEQKALEEWKETGTGPLAQPVQVNQMALVRFPDTALPFVSIDGGDLLDPTGGMNSPHVEFSLVQITSKPPQIAGGDPKPSQGSTNVTIQMTVVNLHPVSRGSIMLTSSNPFDYPAIDFGILTQPKDVAIIREGIRSARRLFSAPSFQGSVFGTVLPGANVTSDEDLDTYIRSATLPFLHAVGSAAMSARGAAWGVVDPDFKVKGTRGLRAVDASVIPLTPSAHTQVPVYGMAERASVLIAEAWE